ncbi:hypothetical protein M406DRAFT_349693 [Cryphonectria parasitica EP155]|uniref:Uncharacterized protein n=1 Tax=Cryphonectria parasitica (strain ATCC 38755 / EP155) TaxID=660469 RepID=A0A9P5CSD6_CRYP1|nr:uncharacterized protein M406DRAFT_349693 [Cryphonectria parasitica EP155]KAF3768201.1 hypothetical protein M406DRAFT_349693 [Cryphonectria parasitica EP155]
MASSSMSQAVPWDDDTEGKKLEIRDSLESEGSGSWEIFSPKDEHCGIWHSSPNKERHASFGDKGTTASTTCYGDLIQTSQFLGAGHSGMFTIDQKSTSEPCYVESRARDLHSNSTDPGSDFSFGLEVPDDLCPDQEIPPEVNWVHWRWPRLGFRSDLQIRDLDFVDGLYLFNFDTAGMFEVPGPLGHGYVHVNILNPSPITSEKEDDQQANSDPQPNQPPERTSLGVTSTLQDQPQTDESQEAQGLSMISIEETDTDVTEAGQQDAASLTSEGFKGGQITDSPTGAPNVFLASQALTCGDMSGHRVNTPASFFAFRFLVDVARRLKKCQTKTEYMTSLEERIKTTCGGHITWLQQLREAERHKAEKGNFLQTGCFSANYWVTGEVMPESSHSWLPPNAITDTALQILKVAEYMKLGPQGDAKDKAEQIINDVYLPWLVELDRLDIRKAFAWPHAGVEGINTFRLDDHFWIWKALKFLDDRAKKVQPSLRLRDDAAREKEAKRLKKHHPWLERLRLTGEKSMVEAAKKFAAIAKRLAPSNVQRGILQRFTTENDVSRRRMLAVTRSARETRFLFHARDTALFYGEDSHFFPPISFDQLWANTIETQPYHEDNQDVVWDNALRYALGIVMGTRGHTLNKDTAARLVQKCVSILIGAGDHDAFFPGELKEGGREPAIFYGEEYRDFFYHAGFEINHVLLSNARKIDEIFQEVDETQPGNSEQAKSSSPSSSTEEECRRLIQSTLAEMLGVSSQQRFDRVLQAIDTTPRVLNNARSLLMKKSLPFTNVIYASNVNSIEEEWLYNYPDFLSGSEIDNEDVESRLGRERSSSESAKTTIARAISKADPQISRGSKAIPTLKTILDSLRGRHLSFCVFDCKKQKGLGRRQKKQERDRRYLVSDNQGLLNLLKAPRTAELAKKRFIWLPYADSGTALACWTASPERESHAISLFFDRHARYEGNVWDDTSILLNEWQTELHFSFYVLVEKQDTCGDTELLVKADRPFPGRAGKLLQRASISFRFDGDFFDRYWTCHFIEHVPGEEDSDQDLPFPPGSEKELDSSDRSSNNNEQKKWWQRRVLEPYLLNRALDKIAHASCLFLDEQFEHALQSMEDDLTSTLSTVQKWNSREKDRGEENPRWTRNDEKKYRAAIKKLCNATRDKTDTLNIRRADIRRLKEALTARRSGASSERKPSFYSMNGAPDHTTIVSLVVFAFAAFAVTVAVLLSSRIVFKVFTHDVEPKLSKAASSMDGMIRDVARNVQHIRGGGVVDFFLEFSARRVVCAVMALRGDKLSAQAALNVLAGVFLTPVLGLSWLVKALLVNIFDILEACRIDTRNWQPVFPSDAQTEPRPHTTQDQYLIDEILEIPQIMRPFKR